MATTSITALYHGTTSACLEDILKNGIKPRALTKRSNWEHTVESNKEVVYLTDAYPLYFAACAVKEKKEDAVVIEIDPYMLDELKLIPDEDVLEQANRGKDHLPAKWDMKKRTAYYRKAALGFVRTQNLDGDWLWEVSLRLMGTMGHVGVVPARAIRRVAIIDYKKQIRLMMAVDPSMTILNYRFCGNKYKALTRWVFGEPFPELDEVGKFMNRALFEFLEKHGRDGIKIIEVNNEPKR